jgi:alkaline phosphatase
VRSDFVKSLFLGVVIVVLTTSIAAQSNDIQYPKNIVLVIADGMGLAHVGVFSEYSKSFATLQRFPVVGIQKTHSASHLVTDSGAAATAMACGEKTYNSAIGMGADTTRCKNLFEYASDAGKATGIVVTSSLVHATPGAFVGHQPFRGFREAIASDFLDSGLDYIVGGGLVYFTNRFTDDRDLRQEMEASGYAVYDYGHMSFKNFLKKDDDKVVYFTSHLEPERRNEGRDYLSKATAHGMRKLREQGPDGFFMMVEASQVDFAGHDNDKNYLIAELRDFGELLDEVFAFAQEDGNTLVIVTADHSTGGLSIESGKPGKGRVRFSFETSRHTADMVPVFAYGPAAEIFGGVYENTQIFQKIREVGGF